MTNYRRRQPPPAVLALSRAGIDLDTLALGLGVTRAKALVALEGKGPTAALLNLVRFLAGDAVAEEVEVALAGSRRSRRGRR